MITVVPASSPQTEAVSGLVERLRDDLLATVHVGGTTAAFVD